ncbi:hypothetical protein [Actinoplanes derwentensis]|uniref:Uncharacterized protein n=1 Tax=Actinoplanes derwentensis TaxID=113562 RepID=A0A1H2D2G7_9ACTN|nr:hypothetical protein [Actinoplanes derwentensis]GID86834.1 hypothetical protein Ade03nite_57580 [Actinoplanes derwentensis]SDT76737.1 hypothetical protein SAMN04489716_7716 [Actinoplanes derwentensis]
MLGIPRRAQIIAAGLVTASLSIGSIAWASWRLAGSGNSTATAGSVVELRTAGHAQPDTALYPGAITGLLITVANDNGFPVRVTTVRPGSGRISIDEKHRSAGCHTSGVALTEQFFNVSWAVPARSEATFLLPESIRMTEDSDSACQDATFRAPLAVIGRSDAH